PVYLGDDLYCCQPACEAVLEAGGSFLFTCKPKSHATLYEYIQGVEVDSLRTVEGKGRKKVHCFYRWMSGVPVRVGEDALKVNWFEITVASPDSSPGRGSPCREPKNSGRATCCYHCSSKISELGETTA
ncbi:MAG: hypothetical protein OXC26_06400, partial [Albidovulum sp.]|nr:hypothetical protein [Albidovulum sp.]